MIVIRVFTGIKNHFPTRVMEWALAVIAINWGIRLLTVDNVLTLFPSFTNMSNIMSEDMWGIFCVIAGFARLIALVINGTFSGTLYSKYSPHLRAFGAALCAFLWSQIVISMLGTIPISPGLAVYSVFIMLEIYCVSSALNEAGKQPRSQ